MRNSAICSVRFEIELDNGNTGRGNQWFSSARLRKQYERQLLSEGFLREPFGFPVRLELTRILGPNQRKWDADSILRGNAKEIIDAMVAIGFFVDDSPKYIVSVIGLQDDNDRKSGPAIKIDIFKE